MGTILIFSSVISAGLNSYITREVSAVCGRWDIVTVDPPATANRPPQFVEISDESIKWGTQGKSKCVINPLTMPKTIDTVDSLGTVGGIYMLRDGRLIIAIQTVQKGDGVIYRPRNFATDEKGVQLITLKKAIIKK